MINKIDKQETSYCLDANYWKDTTPEQFLTKNRRQLVKDSCVINPLKNKTPYGWHFEQQVYDVNGITRTIKAGEGSGNIPKIIDDTQGFDGVRCYNHYSPTLRSERSGLKVYFPKKHLIRKLTPKECFRLMDVSDEDYEKLEGISNTQKYKLAGNSIVVNVLTGIFKELFSA